jgi:hypothetical protein
MEAFLFNNLEKNMHSETDIFRNFLISQKKILFIDSQKPLDEMNFICLIQVTKSLIKTINILTKLFRLVDDHHSLIPLTEKKDHNFFERNLSDIFKLSNFLMGKTKNSFAKQTQLLKTTLFSTSSIFLNSNQPVYESMND